MLSPRQASARISKRRNVSIISKQSPRLRMASNALAPLSPSRYQLRMANIEHGGGMAASASTHRA